MEDRAPFEWKSLAEAGQINAAGDVVLDPMGRLPIPQLEKTESRGIGVLLTVAPASVCCCE
jgi:hypothetical protein